MKRLLLSGLLLVILFSSGCKKAGNHRMDPVINGSVKLIDKHNQILTDVSGINVSVENGGSLQSLAVDKHGRFEVPPLKGSETITLVYSYPGYGTVRQYFASSDLEGKTGIDGVFLLPKSSVVVNSLSGQLTGNVFKMSFNVAAQELNDGNGVTFFVEKNNADVSFTNCPGNNSVSRFLTVAVNDGDNSATFCLKCAKECGFLQSGDTVYLKAYGDFKSPFSSAYIDRLTNKLVFPSINEITNSSTISFVVP
jgi:hypothetical protein